MNPTQIAGWMSLKELVWLGSQASRCQIVLELGAWKGRSSYALAAGVQGRLHVVDHWLGSLGHRGPKQGHHDWQGTKNEFLQNMQEFIDQRKLVIHEGDCETVLPGLASWFRADMIFLDAGHEYAEVKRDIMGTLPLLVSGGLLCGHDYDAAGWQGVKKACKELLPGHTVATESIWEWRKP